MPPPEQLARQRLQRLRHANVVAHLDVFEIDADSFCTILELCKGPDLEHVLRAGPLPERVATPKRHKDAATNDESRRTKRARRA